MAKNETPPTQEEVLGLVAVHRTEIKQSYPFRSPLNHRQFPVKYETNHQPSKTIPDQSLSVREIMDRYARGLSLDGERVPVYDGENDELQGLDIRKLDLSEKHDLVEQNKQRIEEMRQDLQDQKDKKGKYAPKPKQLDPGTSSATQNQGDAAAPSAAQADKQKEPKE